MLKKFLNYTLTFKENINNDQTRRADLHFKFRNNLIYYINFNNNRERLCILKILKTHIFHLTHNMQYYKNYYYLYNKIINLIYMRHL